MKLLLLHSESVPLTKAVLLDAELELTPMYPLASATVAPLAITSELEGASLPTRTSPELLRSEVEP